MKPLFLLFIFVALLTITVKAQTTEKKKHHFDETTVVIDSAGMQYPYAVWKKMVNSRDYKLKKMNPENDSSAYLLVKLDSAQKADKLSRVKEPKESTNFVEGQKVTFPPFTDIKGNYFSSKDLEGKVVVLNFWYINGLHSQEGIPELNKLALQYANNSNVIFISVVRDSKSFIEDYIKENPFSYHIIADGRAFIETYWIRRYPVNVVLDKNGIVRYNSVGYRANVPYLIRKTIDDIK